jgi:nucleotide-binding universal stress UspA family protein
MMVKKILVALDPDSDTPVATRFALDIARRHDAEITGLAVVDMGSIESSSRGGGIGSMYYAEKLRDQLTADARTKAQELLDAFERLVRDSDVRFTELVQEGVPFERIVEDMKVHDLLIVGREPHFFYSHPKESTATLARIVRLTVGPTLIVHKQERDVKKVLIAYDGSTAAARAMRSFVLADPFGHDVDVRLVAIYRDTPTEAEFFLQQADGYMKAHGYDAHRVTVLDSDIDAALLAQIAEYGADLVVAGAHSKSTFRAMAFGSTTKHLVDHCPVPLFLDS